MEPFTNLKLAKSNGVVHQVAGGFLRIGVAIHPQFDLPIVIACCHAMPLVVRQKLTLNAVCTIGRTYLINQTAGTGLGQFLCAVPKVHQ